MADRSRSRFWINPSTRPDSLRPMFTASIARETPRRMLRAVSEPSASPPVSERLRRSRSCGSERLNSTSPCAISLSAISMPTSRLSMPCSPSRPAATTAPSAAAIWSATAPTPTRSAIGSALNCAVVVRGNHDRASTGQDDLEWFNPVARNAAVWTLRNSLARKRRLHPGTPPGSRDRGELSRSSTARPTTRTSTSSPPARPGRHSATWKRASPSSATPTCRADSSGTSRAWRPSSARRRAAIRSP